MHNGNAFEPYDTSHLCFLYCKTVLVVIMDNNDSEQNTKPRKNRVTF